MTEVKKSKIAKDYAIGDVWDRIDILTDEMGCENLLEETYKALSSDKANEILEYIARNHGVEFDEPEYFASTKKSKMKKTPLVDINADDIALSINFYSSGMTDVENGTVKFDAQGDFLGGRSFGKGGITTSVERFSYPISDFVNPDVIREVKGMVADAMIDQINDEWGIEDGNIKFRNDFANINGYSASTKKSKPAIKMSFNDNVNAVRKTNYAKTGNINQKKR